MVSTGFRFQIFSWTKWKHFRAAVRCVPDLCWGLSSWSVPATVMASRRCTTPHGMGRRASSATCWRGVQMWQPWTAKGTRRCITPSWWSMWRSPRCCWTRCWRLRLTGEKLHERTDRADRFAGEEGFLGTTYACTRYRQAGRHDGFARRNTDGGIGPSLGSLYHRYTNSFDYGCAG